MPEPLYTAENCRTAYQLRWSLTTFATEPMPDETRWRASFAAVIEADGARLLEVHAVDSRTTQFFLSSQPAVAPSQVSRSVKGRLQYLLRGDIPQLWQRHYSLTSVGETNNSTLQAYVGRQVEHHPMADPSVADLLTRMQFHDPRIDLDAPRASAYGRFSHNLHIVLENAERLPDLRADYLAVLRSRLIAICAKKGWLLSRLGIVSNHVHLLVGCGVQESPQDIALSLMNNLAFAQEMRRIYDFSFYVGTFGAYDCAAIRRNLSRSP